MPVSSLVTTFFFFFYYFLKADNDNYKARFLKRKGEDKVLEISDLKAFTRYSVVIIAFTGDVNAALLEGKASSPVIVSTFEAGLYFFYFIQIKLDSFTLIWQMNEKFEHKMGF